MKLISISVSGFFGFEQPTIVNYIDNRVICVGANGSGKSNMPRLIEFFLLHGTGPNVKIHWEQGDSTWEPHKQCVASLVFQLTPSTQDIFAKWRLTAILSLLRREKNIEQLILDIEEQDITDPSVTFSHVQIHPDEVMDEFGVENSPLFKKLKSNTKTTVPRVKVFWDMIENALLSVYADKKPYDTAIYYAHTEARDRTSVVFQQILCCDHDRNDILRQLNSVSLSDKTRLVFPIVCTIEEEIKALKQVFCGKKNSTHMQYHGVTLIPYMNDLIWAEVEEHLRFGIPPINNPPPISSPPSDPNSHSSTPLPIDPKDILINLSSPNQSNQSNNNNNSTNTSTLLSTSTSATTTNTNANININTISTQTNLNHSALVQKRARRHLSGDLCLSNCGFTSSLIPGENPATISIDDVRSWCHNLLRKTEPFMKNRDQICHTCSVKSVNQILRRLLLKSVCILSQDRAPTNQSEDYLMVTQDSVQSIFMKLLESGDKADTKAISQIQEGMKTLVGQELQSHRYFGTGALVIGLQPTGSNRFVGSGLKSIGGGFKELLMVLTALHGSGADSVILDSPGFSLHPPQQKALALWMAKHSTASLMIITNSTEYVTEDALPSLYCFRRVIQNVLKLYSINNNNNNNNSNTTNNKNNHKINQKTDNIIGSSNNSAFSSPELGVHIYEKPSIDSKVLRILDRDNNKDLEFYCRKYSAEFLQIADKSGYILTNDLKIVDNSNSFSPYHDDDNFQEESEIVTRVRPIHNSKVDDSEMLRILDPALKRLVFASGVFFFEGQSDYRVIEALKHVANNVAWEIITMHGAGEIQKVVNIVDALGIPYGVVVDYDQIMPTVSRVKQVDTVDMRLWRSSSIYRFIVDRCGKGAPLVPLTAPSSPTNSSTSSSTTFSTTTGINSSTNFVSKTVEESSAEELLNMLTSFRRNHSDDQEFSQKLQQLTIDLKSSLQQAGVYKERERQPTKDKFSRTLEKIENIINDSTIHMAIRSALVRKELRDIGVFTWNSDLEGMIFGYGDPAHCEQIINSMPISMKNFCMEQSSTLSGSAFAMFTGSGCPILNRPIIRDGSSSGSNNNTNSRDKKNSRTSSSATTTSSSGTYNDYDRVLYLIRSLPGKELLSIDLPKYYQMAFGIKFKCMNGGISLPFSVLVDKLKTNPNIKITPLEFGARSTPIKSITSTPVPDSLYIPDDDGGSNGIEPEELEELEGEGEVEGDYNSQFSVLSDVDEIPSDGDDNNNESEESDQDDIDDLADSYETKLSYKRGTKDNSNNNTFNDAIIKGGNKKKNKGKGKEKGKDKDREKDKDSKKDFKKDHKGKLDFKKTVISESTPTNKIPSDISTSTPKGTDSDDHSNKLYRFEWIGENSSFSEPLDHVFHNPDYWTFVGSILHGAKDRGGMWKRLPWSVLKDVISSTKNAKIPDNNIGKYLNNDDLRRYGRQSGLIPLHIGLQDLVDWMDEMETKALLMNHSNI